MIEVAGFWPSPPPFGEPDNGPFQRTASPPLNAALDRPRES